MKKILFISSILTTFIFTGCGTVNPNLPTQSVDVKKSDVNIPYDGETVFENVENSETLIKVTHKSSGGYKYNILDIIEKRNEEEEEIGKLIAETMKTVTKDGIITLEESKNYNTTVEVVQGMQLDRGYLSPYAVGSYRSSVGE